MYPPTNELDRFAAKFGFTVEGGYYMTNPPIAAGWVCSREQLAKMIQAIAAPGSPASPPNSAKPEV